MRTAICALVFAAFVGIASAYTAPVGASPSGNPIATPGLDQIVPAGAPFNVTWNPTTSGTVDLVLLRGPSTNLTPLYAIATNIPNSGSYLWTPSLSLQPDTTHYGIQLIVDATGAYQYTDQFGISNAANPYVTQSSDGQPEAPATATSFSVTGSSMTTMTVTTIVASTSTSVSAISVPLANSSATYVAPSMGTSTTASMGMNTTVIMPTISMTVPATLMTTAVATVGSSTQAAASPSASTAGASKMVQGCGAVMLGFGGLMWAVL